MSRRIAAKAFEAIPARHERPSPACGGGWVGGASAAAMLPNPQRRAEPPQAFPQPANVADHASRDPPYGVFPSTTSAYGVRSPVPPSEKRNFRDRPSREA